MAPVRQRLRGPAAGGSGDTTDRLVTVTPPGHRRAGPTTDWGGGTWRTPPAFTPLPQENHLLQAPRASLPIPELEEPPPAPRPSPSPSRRIRTSRFMAAPPPPRPHFRPHQREAAQSGAGRGGAP